MRNQAILFGVLSVLGVTISIGGGRLEAQAPDLGTIRQPRTLLDEPGRTPATVVREATRREASPAPRLDALSPSPVWTFEGNSNSAYLGFVMSLAGDVNGDGHGDVLVSAPLLSNGQTNEGRVYAFYGTGSTLPAVPSWKTEGNQASAEYGVAVDAAGDVNGDGFDDVVVGASFWDGVAGGNAGRAYLYLGHASGLDTLPAWSKEGDQSGCEFGRSVVGAGDVNGDGFDDVLVGADRYDHGQTDEGRAYLYLGSASGLSAAPSWTTESDSASAIYGAFASGAGDLNGDGYADVIVGAPWYAARRGKVFIYLGGPAGLSTTPLVTFQGDASNVWLGYSLASVGDVDGDGFGDVVIGEPYSTLGAVDGGALYLFRGGPVVRSDLTLIDVGTIAGGALGFSVAAAGDLNGDGRADAIAGAYAVTRTVGPTTYLHSGQAYAYANVRDSTAGGRYWTGEMSPLQSGAQFGVAVAPVGDITGDGYGDILIGADAYDNGQPEEGLVLLYAGAGDTPNTKPLWTQTIPSLSFGRRLASAGDVNGDGFDEFLLGTPGFSASSSTTIEGRAYLYGGAPGGPSLAPTWTHTGTDTERFVGTDVCGAGDLDADGYDDVAVLGYDSL